MAPDPDPWRTPPPARCPVALQPFVRAISGYAATGLRPAVHRGLPGPTLTLVLALDAPLGVAPTEAAWRVGAVGHHAAPLAGLHTEPAFVVQPGQWSGIQLDLSPLGARRLFGIPAGALPVDCSVVTDLPGCRIDELHERLVAAGEWTRRYALVVGWLVDRLAASDAGGVRPEVVGAWRLLVERRGRVGVAAVADQVGLGRRRLAQLFDAELGVTPKVAGRLMRFDAARRDVQSAVQGAGSLDLSGIAVRHGYVDHAHLVREFRAFTGLSPTGWLAAEVPNVQAGAGSGAAASSP